jgi:protein-S-isoprenylcysteine O-methyltransferase Ste14
MLIFAVAMWALNRYCPVLSLIPESWRVLGWWVMGIAPVTPITAVIQFRREHTTGNPRKPETASTLVDFGVYAWTRNPMYLGLAILLLGWAIKLGSLTPLVVALLFPPLIQRVQIRPEGHALRIRFGKDYEQYCRRVNRWFGRSGHS